MPKRRTKAGECSMPRTETIEFPLIGAVQRASAAKPRVQHGARESVPGEPPKPGETPKTVHVDDWVSNPRNPAYARWMLMHFRLTAEMQIAFKPFLVHWKLFCTFEGRRFRVTGASRMGDVWLHSNLGWEDGVDAHYYEHRVAVNYCSEWSDAP